MNPLSSVRLPRWRGYLPLAAGILLAVFLIGLRWGFVGRYASDLPVWDQWDAEGLHLLAPWREHRPVWPEIFQAHNEHRVVLTKLTNLALAAANGGWDQRLECVFNALLPALIAAGLFLHSRRFCPPFSLPLVWLIMAAGWGLPLAWENMVRGFHSPQFFLIGLSYGAIAWLATAPSWSRNWWLGAACAVLALGSLASGFFAALVVIGLIGWQLARRETDWRRAGPALVVTLAVVVVGAGTRVSVDYHEVLKAHTLRDFFLTFWHSLLWPAPPLLVLALLVWAPWAWLALVVLRSPRGVSCRDGLILLGLGGWVLLQLVATAYVRGAGGLPPPSRYVDLLVFGAVLNALALGWLATRGAPLARNKITVLVSLGTAWLAVVVWGGRQHFRQGWAEMRVAAAENIVAEATTRRFLLTNNPRLLEESGIPYPDPGSFYPRVNHPALRALMPASVRPPLDMPAATNQGFALAGAYTAAALPAGTPSLLDERFWSSWNETGAAHTGEWTSGPLRTDAAWIELRLTGSGAPPDVALEIRDTRMGYLLAVVPPPSRPGVWEKTLVRIPHHGFSITASDRSASGWLAFAAPVEVPALSHLALSATRLGWPLAGVAAGAALLLAGLALWPAGLRRDTPAR